MRSWGESRICRASVIRDILRGRLVADPDPHGLRLQGARITGRLDLENLTTSVSLELSECFLEEGIVARDARLFFLGLDGCRLEHSAESPLDAERLTCSALLLARARIIGHGADGAVNLLGAHIGGQLDCTGAELRNDSGPALYADSLQVGQGMFLSGGFTATGHGADGAVRLPGAHIGGNLDCTGAELRNDSGPALHADSLQVGQAMYLRGGFTATGTAPTARSACPAPTSAASSTAPGRNCATTPAPPCTPTACKSARPCTSAAGSPPPARRRRRGPPARRPHRRPARLHRGGTAQRLRPRPARRQPASRPGHVPPRRVHRHRQRRRRRGPPARRPHRRPVRLHRGGTAQRLRPRPARRQPASRPGHVPPRRIHRHRRR